MILLIDAELVNPPTLLSSFRDFTFFATLYKPHYDVVLECPKEETDMYFKYLKRYCGGLDFVKDFQPPGREAGLIVSNHIERLPQVYTDRIIPENLVTLLTKIGFHRFRD